MEEFGTGKKDPACRRIPERTEADHTSFAGSKVVDSIW